MTASTIIKIQEDNKTTEEKRNELIKKIYYSDEYEKISKRNDDYFKNTEAGKIRMQLSGYIYIKDINNEISDMTKLLIEVNKELEEK